MAGAYPYAGWLVGSKRCRSCANGVPESGRFERGRAAVSATPILCPRDSPLPGFRSGLQVSKTGYGSFLGPACIYQADAAVMLNRFEPVGPSGRYDAVFSITRI
jgi:hypothetical protein